MVLVWMLFVIFSTSILVAEGRTNSTKGLELKCDQTDRCTSLGGICFSSKPASYRVKAIKKKGRKVWCNKKTRCQCFRVLMEKYYCPPMKTFDFNITAGFCFDKNTDYTFNDILPPPYFVNATSAIDCQNMCYNKPGCDFFTYNPSRPSGDSCTNPAIQNACYLKNATAATNPQLNNCSVSGPSVCLPETCFDYFTDYTFNDILPPPYYVTATSIRDCQNICYNNPDCEYFTYNPYRPSGYDCTNPAIQNACYLKNANAPTNPQFNNCSVSGPSVCPPGICRTIESQSFGANFYGAPGPFIFNNDGCPFSDGTGVHLFGDITEIKIWSDVYVSAIQIKYGNVWGDLHGNPGVDTMTSLVLNTGEKILVVEGRDGFYIDQLTFKTDNGRTLGPVGGPGGSAFISSFPGCFLYYISGETGDVVYQLTYHWECPE